MEFSKLIFTLVLVSVLFMGLGGFYYSGATNYGVENITDFAAYNQSSELFDEINNDLAGVNEGSIVPSDFLGFVLNSVSSTVKGFTGFITIGTSFANNALGFIPSLPSWVVNVVIMGLTTIVTIALISTFLRWRV